MEMPLRATFKLTVACSLIAESPSIQLILLMLFNLCVIIYTCMYSPSKNRVTNYLNILLHFTFMGM